MIIIIPRMLILNLVDEYYESIGAIKPASSVDGKKLFDATDATNGGRTATEFKEVDTEAQLKQRTTKVSEAIKSDGTSGYYVDIPVHLRTNKRAPGADATGDIYYKMTISSYNPENPTEAGSTDLYKAVRVAFLNYDSTDTLSSKIYGIDSAYYDSTNAVSGKSAKTASNITTDGVYATDAYEAGAYKDSTMDLPLAATENYGHLDFVVRVWLEGESTSCYNDKQGQSWNIDLAFSLGDPAANANAEG